MEPERIEELKTLIQQYVPPGYHCRRAEETIALVYQWLAEVPSVACHKCGEERVCLKCNEPDVDITVRINGQTFFY